MLLEKLPMLLWLKEKVLALPKIVVVGVWGYEDLLRIHAKKRRSKEEKERLQWYNMHYREFNPEECNIECAQEFVSALWDELTMQE